MTATEHSYSWFERTFLRMLALQQRLFPNQQPFWNWNGAVYSMGAWLFLISYTVLLGVCFAFGEVIPRQASPLYSDGGIGLGLIAALAIACQFVTGRMFSEFRDSPEAARQFGAPSDMRKLILLFLSGVVAILSIPFWFWMADL